MRLYIDAFSNNNEHHLILYNVNQISNVYSIFKTCTIKAKTMYELEKGVHEFIKLYIHQINAVCSDCPSDYFLKELGNIFFVNVNMILNIMNIFQEYVRNG